MLGRTHDIRVGAITAIQQLQAVSAAWRVCQEDFCLESQDDDWNHTGEGGDFWKSHTCKMPHKPGRGQSQNGRVEGRDLLHSSYETFMLGMSIPGAWNQVCCVLEEELWVWVDFQRKGQQVGIPADKRLSCSAPA